MSIKTSARRTQFARARQTQKLGRSRFSQRRLSLYVLLWVATALAIAGSAGELHDIFKHNQFERSGMEEPVSLMIAGVLLAALYFVRGFAKESTPEPEPEWDRSHDNFADEDLSKAVNGLVGWWLSTTCALALCLIGVLAFSIRTCQNLKLYLNESAYGLLGWLLPWINVALIVAGLVFVLGKLLTFYGQHLRGASLQQGLRSQATALNEARHLLNWQQIFDGSICVLVAMGITALAWFLSGAEVLTHLTLDHTLALGFGTLALATCCANFGPALQRITETAELSN